VEKVYEKVKGLAIDYHFRPGERVNEVELAAQLGVSRTPVREALNRLAKDGFMNVVPNRGFTPAT
jgi:DNA-binding GntR family transcriptional regulator